MQHSKFTLGFVVLIALSAQSVDAAQRLVPQQYSTIQAAITASVSGDSVLVSPGNYAEGINFSGRNITVRSVSGASVTTINATGLGKRCAQFTSGETNAATLDGFTLKGGSPTSGTLPGHGAGILCCYSSSPTILNCVVRDGLCELGAGIYSCQTTCPRIGNTVFCNNLATSGYGWDIAQCFVDLGGNTVCAECGCSPGAIVEWPVAQGGNGHYYQAKLRAAQLGWNAAQSDAVATGANLVSIESAGEQSFTKSLMRPYSNAYWIGLSQAAGSVEPLGGWSWLNGSALNYAAWQPGQPDNANSNQHYGAMLLTSNLSNWSDWREDGETFNNRLGIRGWMLEWSADCNNDGIVDYGQVLSGELSDRNANTIPDCCEQGMSCTCMGDVTNDASVDGFDIAAVLEAWNSNGQGKFNTDVNNDGAVNAFDLGIVLDTWGPCPN
jgi:Lectin C-type domain/Dockerin type I domain